MNNPNKLSYAERAITPTQDFNKGINYRMPKEKRLAKKQKSKTK
tara:strand:+ start:1395 stop:1526 length:132 start_codon:yes stop_codon:yes gene_type:complete